MHRDIIPKIKFLKHKRSQKLTKDKTHTTYKRQNAQETQKKKDQETKEVHQGNRRSV